MTNDGPVVLPWKRAAFDKDGEQWAVDFVAPSLCMYEKRQCWGWTLFEERRVILNIAQSMSAIAETLMHEKMHVARGHHERMAWDEKFIHHTERPLWAMMEAMGAKLPPLPRGYAAFRAYYVLEES